MSTRGSHLSHVASVAALFAVLVLVGRTSWADTPLDVLQRTYAPYTDPNDDLAFPLKVKSLTASPYKFWRGAKDLFFAWAKTNAGDWLASRESFVASHADLHLGNIGSYPSDHGWGELAFGMVDFDDAAVLPFQIELLQGAVTLRLVASENSVAVDDANLRELTDRMIDAYVGALRRDETATELLRASRDAWAIELLDPGERAPYERELAKYAPDGKFVGSIHNKKGRLTEILRPVTEDARKEQLAGAIAEAIAHAPPEMRERFRLREASAVRAAMKVVSLRTRLGSSGSQGLHKYLVLLEHPLNGIEHDAIVYLKQQVPSAAERAGVVARDPRPAAERSATLALQLTAPRPFFMSWGGTSGDESFLVTVKEPWSDELDPDDVKSPDDLRHAADLWGAVAGPAHRAAGANVDTTVAAITPALRDLIDQRSRAYAAQVARDFEAFRSDERVKALCDRADAAVRSIERAK